MRSALLTTARRAPRWPPISTICSACRKYEARAASGAGPPRAAGPAPPATTGLLGDVRRADLARRDRLAFGARAPQEGAGGLRPCQRVVQGQDRRASRHRGGLSAGRGCIAPPHHAAIATSPSFRTETMSQCLRETSVTVDRPVAVPTPTRRRVTGVGNRRTDPGDEGLRARLGRSEDLHGRQARSRHPVIDDHHVPTGRGQNQRWYRRQDIGEVGLRRPDVVALVADGARALRIARSRTPSPTRQSRGWWRGNRQSASALKLAQASWGAPTSISRPQTGFARRRPRRRPGARPCSRLRTRPGARRSAASAGSSRAPSAGNSSSPSLGAARRSASRRRSPGTRCRTPPASRSERRRASSLAGGPRCGRGAAGHPR